nr:PREDICTED: RNA-binding protein 34-like [Apteryx mantelli mantelli]
MSSVALLTCDWKWYFPVFMSVVKWTNEDIFGKLLARQIYPKLQESALEQADEEKEQKEFQSKEKQKNQTSHAITKRVVNSDTGITVEQQKKKNEAEEMIKNRRTVFVGNLPVNCTAQMLKSLFKEYGQIESIRFRSVVPAEDTLSKKLAAIKRKIHPNMKYINAYVVFKEECDAIKALKK